MERSWTAPTDDPNFWNPKLRGPLCLNPQAARSYLPITIKKTELILAGQSKAEMVDGIKAAFDKKELPTLEPGAMCYMLSRQGYLDDPRRALASSPDVFCSASGRCNLGRKPARLADFGV